MTREELIGKSIMQLKERFFQADTFLESNTCFDIIAKSGEKTIYMKVYENIDAIRKAQAEELKKISKVLNVPCIIIGEKSKAATLRDNTVYFRYEVPAVNTNTFEKLLDNMVPEAKYFKGRYIAEILPEELRKKREELKLSMKELALKIGVANETLRRFEKGASTSVDTAKRLEEELGNGVIKKFDVLEYRPEMGEIDEIPDEELLEKVHELGVKLALFEHAPFHAFGEKESGIFISRGKGKSDLVKKAVELKKTGSMSNKGSMIVTKEYKYSSVDGIPIINEDDLETISKFKDLKKLIQEREEKENK